MSWAHAHLLVNHLPIVGFPIATLFLFLALVSRERAGWVRAAIVMEAISLGGVVSAYVTGGPAIDDLEHIARTSGAALERHHLGAVASLIAAGVVLLMLVVVLAARRYQQRYATAAIVGMFVVSVIASAILAWMSVAGGRVNHPELQHADDHRDGPVHEH